MPRVQIPIADGFYVSQSGPLVTKRLVNFHPVIPQADAANQKALFGSPGINQFAELTADNSRGSIVFADGTPYFVIGNSLISLSSSGDITDHGEITGTSDVSLDTNGINIAIQDPIGDSYFFTPSTNTLELNNSSEFLSFGQAETVTFKDGYYVYTTKTNFFSSSTKTVNDGKDFNALDFADAEVSPDRIIAGHNNHNQLYIAGRKTIEVFQTIATTGFPFQRINGATIQKGVLAPNSIIEFDNTFLFIGGGEGERPAIWRALGSSIQKISTSSIDHLLHQNTDDEIAGARAFTYALSGSYYAVFTVGDNTFVYDGTTSTLAGSPQWHERQTGITDGNGFQAWRAIHGLLAYGKILVADDRSGKIGELTFDAPLEYGDKIERIVSTQPLIDQGETLFSHEVELFGKTGLGDSNVSDPQIRMDYSDDGGRTFNSEITRSMGKVGEYEARMRWTRLGRFPNSRVFRWKISDPITPDIYALYANAEGTSSG